MTPTPPPVGGVWRRSRFAPVAGGDGEAVPVHLLTVTHAAPNPVLFYAAISNFLVLRVRAE